MDFNDNQQYLDEYGDGYSTIEESQLRKSTKGTIKDFALPGVGAVFNINDKKKLPSVRNSYLRVAFFKCYFSRVIHSGVDKKPEETLRIFAKLFYYHQEVRIGTRKAFNRFNKEMIERDEIKALKEYLKQKIHDGCRTLSELPIPELPIDEIRKKLSIDNFDNQEKQDSEVSNFFKGTDRVDITFNPKRRDFPRPNELFLKLTDKDANDIQTENGRRFITLLPRNHSINDYISLSSKNAKLWDQALALLVLDSIEELEQEINKTGIIDNYIPLPYIKTAIDHFNQNYPRAKEMDNHEKAYSISLRYKNKKTNTPFLRESVLRAFKRKKSSS